MKRAAIIILAFAQAACQTPTVTRTETVEVRIPVAVQPITKEQVPIAPAPLGPRPPGLSAAADTLLAKWCEAVAYILAADPLLRVSAGETPGPALDYPECRRR